MQSERVSFARLLAGIVLLIFFSTVLVASGLLLTIFIVFSLVVMIKKAFDFVLVVA